MLMELSIKVNNSSYEMISGILFGFIGIPVFSIILPLWIAKRWRLHYSFWPRNKNLFLVIPILVLYVLLTSFESIRLILESGISLGDFIIHYFNAMLFHVTYYPLFVVFIFPILRKNFKLVGGLILTSLAFAVYHLAQFHYFPAGLSPIFQLYLFAGFFVNLLLYLWSESIILMTIVHTMNGAIGLAANGTVFNQISFLSFLTIVIIGALFIYMIYQALKNRKLDFDKDWWLQVSIKNSRD